MTSGQSEYCKPELRKYKEKFMFMYISFGQQFYSCNDLSGTAAAIIYVYVGIVRITLRAGFVLFLLEDIIKTNIMCAKMVS